MAVVGDRLWVSDSKGIIHQYSLNDNERLQPINSLHKSAIREMQTVVDATGTKQLVTISSDPFIVFWDISVCCCCCSVVFVFIID
jgi:hypothetical protein